MQIATIFTSEVIMIKHSSKMIKDTVKKYDNSESIISDLKYEFSDKTSKYLRL